MFDNFTKKLAKKMGQSVHEVTQPIQNKVSTVANNKVDLWSRVLRLGVLIFLFVDGTRRVTAEPKQNESGPVRKDNCSINSSVFKMIATINATIGSIVAFSVVI